MVVLGGSGYVAGELLRLLAAHPTFTVAAVGSAGHVGETVGRVFPHLTGTAAAELQFLDIAEVTERLEPGGRLGIFAATPHGSTAATLDTLLSRAEVLGAEVRAVDLSADFRFADPDRFASLYGKPHGAPGRCAQFVCAVPEHAPAGRVRHATQPGCFTTAVVLAAFPLLVQGLCADAIFVSAVTGSSGAGRTPGPTTHHPERRSNLFAYAPLTHRHEAEMRALLAPAHGGVEPDVEFVPHSGPFVRGIHATIRLTLREALAAETIAEAIGSFYRNSRFVSCGTTPPRLADVVGSNGCRIGVAVRGHTLVVTSVLDNLVKGAAGGAIQWMNRLFDLPDEAGLELPGLGWY
ncbi:MAG: N-acetyl-gamma-glutamyl-phosphate reductase [Thermoanaerobaculales bacterium]